MLAGHTQLPTLTGRRVALRWLTARDVPALLAVFGDPEVVRYMDHGAHASEADAAALLAHIEAGFAARTLFQWGVTRRDDDAVIGTCTLFGLANGHRRAEIGYALARPAWGQGIMAEALPLALDFAFDVLGLHRVEADVDPRNAASLRSLARLGFAREGYLRERYHVHGEIQDSVFLGLLAAEWRARRGAAPGAGP
jgi:RimJ/RimL family protein N-acetyltransferase